MNTDSTQPPQDPSRARAHRSAKSALIACLAGWLLLLFVRLYVTDPTADRILEWISTGVFYLAIILVVNLIALAKGTDAASVRERSQAVLLEFDEPIRPALERLNKIKDRAQIVGIFIGMLLAVMLVFADMPARLMHVVLGQVPGQRYLITPYSIYIGIPLVLLGIISAAPFTSMIMRIYAGPMWETWKRYERRRASANFELQWTGSMLRDLGAFFSIVLALVAVSILLFANSFSRVTDTGVYVHPTLSIVGRDYTWRDVRKMTWDDLNYSVEFQDGYTWGIQASGPGSSEIANAMSYISQRSGVKIVANPGSDRVSHQSAPGS